MITDSTITVFNRRRNASGTEELVPTVIQRCTWYFKHIVSGSEMMDNADEYSVRIPLNAIAQDGRKYLPGHLYSELSDDDVLKYWTIQKNDLVARGDFAGVSANQPAIQKMTDDCFLVSTFGDNTWRGSRTVKHWRVGGS